MIKPFVFNWQSTNHTNVVVKESGFAENITSAFINSFSKMSWNVGKLTGKIGKKAAVNGFTLSKWTAKNGFELSKYLGKNLLNISFKTPSKTIDTMHRIYRGSRMIAKLLAEPERSTEIESTMPDDKIKKKRDLKLGNYL